MIYEVQMDAYCCHLGCPKDAEFEILNLRPNGKLGELAGPDPYSDYTHACEEHVGNLLGWQPNASSPDEIYWKVTRLYCQSHVPVCRP